MNDLRIAVVSMGFVCLAYSIAAAVIHTILSAIGWRAVEQYVVRRPMRDYNFVGTSEMSQPVSIVVPVHNEGPTVTPAVRALMASQFVNLEVIVVNDGSTDDTFESLAQAFELVEVNRVPRANLPTMPIRAVYASPVESRVVVIDKENGGKSDALNAGLRYARFPLICAIDGDTILDPGALSRLVWEFHAHPDTVAAGGIVRVVNGSDVRQGRIVSVAAPKRILENIQILEYLRAFLGARIGWSKAGMLLVISGAFGLFRRDVLIEAGGYDTRTVGEDAELVLRLHRNRRDRGLGCRIVFFPDPICWTEVPRTWRQLARQRDRWQRGLIEMLWRHRDMIGRPHYGRIGLVALPYNVVFGLLEPVVLTLGYAALIIGVSLGMISPVITALLVGLIFGHGLLLTFTALLMEERAFRRYAGWRCLRRLILASLVENFGYRQFMHVVLVRSLWTVFRGRGWGEMPRVGFASTGPPPAVLCLKGGEPATCGQNM